MAKKKTGQKKAAKKPVEEKPKIGTQLREMDILKLYNMVDDLECRVERNSYWLECLLAGGCAFFVTLILFAPGPGGNHHG